MSSETVEKDFETEIRYLVVDKLLVEFFSYHSHFSAITVCLENLSTQFDEKIIVQRRFFVYTQICVMALYADR